MINYPDEFVRQILESVKTGLKQDINCIIEEIKKSLDILEKQTTNRVSETIKQRLFVPKLAVSEYINFGKFMPYSTCSTADFFHPRFAEICTKIDHSIVLHRKLWEWVFIIHKLQETGMLTSGKRGIVFGVGEEKLPALFASFGTSVMATDAPPEIGQHWTQDGQYSDSLEKLRHPEIVSDELFDKNVSFRFCDMTSIDDDLINFDFTWSSCCFEHLGSLEAGMQFFIDSVEKTLKPGGIACHTTEFNLSSDDDTVTEGGTVIYRRKDILNMIDRLKDLGHEVEPFIIAPDSYFTDFFVDVPPYTHDPHARLLLAGYVVTSVGIVVRKKGRKK